MAVYRDRVVPVPRQKGITINRGDKNRVMLVIDAPYDAKLGYARPKRITIGYITDRNPTQMYPTDGYKAEFGREWEKLFGEKQKPVIKKIGLYACAQAANSSTGIIDVLRKTLGEERAYPLLDYCNYSILCASDAASSFAARMSDQVLFSETPYSDSYYSELFGKKISVEDTYGVKLEWIRQCVADGVTSVWLCIDGSNADCSSKGVELAEKGHAKSRKNVDIVSFTYAVTPEGRPVTYELHRGGLVDAKALKPLMGLLVSAGIAVEGVILDRGYCTSDVLRLLDDNGIAYIIMVKGNPAGFTKTVEEYGTKLRMNMEYLIPHTKLCGIQRQCALFKEYAKKDYLTLFYDYGNATSRIDCLLDKLYDEMDKAEAAIREGKIPALDSKFGKYLIIEDDGDARKVSINTKLLQSTVDEKGLYCIASSQQKTPREIYELYVSRQASETQYRFVKNELGYGKVRVHTTPSAHSRFLAGFVSSILRFTIEMAAKKVRRSATSMINEMNLLTIRNLNGIYAYSHTENERQIKFLAQFGESASLLDEVASDENDRSNGRKPVPRHRKPGPKPKRKRAKKNRQARASAEGATEISKPQSKPKMKKKPGPKPGFKRKDVNKDGSPRKKPGPKPGYKRGRYNKDGSPRQKPGPKPGSKSKTAIR